MATVRSKSAADFASRAASLSQRTVSTLVIKPSLARARRPGYNCAVRIRSRIRSRLTARLPYSRNRRSEDQDGRAGPPRRQIAPRLSQSARHPAAAAGASFRSCTARAARCCSCSVFRSSCGWSSARSPRPMPGRRCEPRSARRSPSSCWSVLAWAYFHHFLAGIRHLLMDLHVGMDLKPARQSAAVTLVLAVVLTLAVAVKLW